MIRRLAAAAALLSCSAGANAAWQQAISKHFVVYSDDAPERVRAYTAKLERYDRAMRVMRGFADPAVSPLERVTVYVLDDVGDIAKLYGRGGGDVAGFYNPRASGPVAFVPRRGSGGGKYELSPQEILLHEYAHHMMYSTFGDTAFPPWYVEGFAEFHATAIFDDDGGVTFGAIPMYRLYGIAGIAPLPAKQLLTADPAHLSAEQVQSMYGRGWLLTHYLTTDPERRKQLDAYIDAINAGVPASEAAKALDVGTLERRLTKYTSEQIRVFIVHGDKLVVPDISVRALGPGEAAVMPALILSKRGVDAKSASRVVALARKLAAPYPNDAAAQNELAEAEFDAGNDAAAQAAADRALAADPNSVHALLYEGMSRERRLMAAKSTDAAAWSATRSWYSRANHLDPEYAYPLQLYYSSYRAARLQPTANAAAGLVYAHVLAPYDPDLGLGAAYVLLKQGKADDAKAVLKPIAYSPHQTGEAGVAARLLGAMDKGGVAGALAMFGDDGSLRPTSTEAKGAAAASR